MKVTLKIKAIPNPKFRMSNNFNNKLYNRHDQSSFESLIMEAYGNAFIYRKEYLMDKKYFDILYNHFKIKISNDDDLGYYLQRKPNKEFINNLEEIFIEAISINQEDIDKISIFDSITNYTFTTCKGNFLEEEAKSLLEIMKEIYGLSFIVYHKQLSFDKNIKLYVYCVNNDHLEEAQLWVRRGELD